MGLADDVARHNADLRRNEAERARHDLLHVGPPPAKAVKSCRLCRDARKLAEMPGRPQAGRDRGPGAGREVGALVTRAEKYFEHYFDGRRSLAVHRLDELVQVTFTHGPDDLTPDVMFLGPTAAGALVEAIDAAARDGAEHFAALEAATARPPAIPRTPRAEADADGLPLWGPAFTFGGLPYTMCPAGDGRVGPGQSAVPETATGRIWHDDCAETAREALSRPDPLTSASAPSGELSAAASAGGADGAAGADRASAVPCRPAAPSPSGRS